MFLFMTRRERESAMVQAMIGMYCRAKHTGKHTLCPECQALAQYAEKRLLSCMYGELKPVCKVCPVHCYSPSMRGQMQQVMRWAGPKMILRKPAFAIMHVLDSITSPKPKTSPKAGRK
jgi:hypothetical protein